MFIGKIMCIEMSAIVCFVFDLRPKKKTNNEFEEISTFC